MECDVLLGQILKGYRSILGRNLVGIYVHGSIAFGCFNWNKSDIDFLVVTKSAPTQQQKESLIGTLLRLNDIAPPKGFEMSLLLERYCADFVYPTPYELHFSNAHIQKCKEDPAEFCRVMNGTDADLAVHITVIKKTGITLYGRRITETFGEVQKECFLDSIKHDIVSAADDIINNSLDTVLNLCRTLAFIRADIILSKEQGGLWGIKNLPDDYTDLIASSLECYRSNIAFTPDSEKSQRFCRYMKNEIFAQ